MKILVQVMKVFSILLFIMSLFIIPVYGQDIQFTASVDKNMLSLDESLMLTLQITGRATNIPGTPELPKLDGFAVASGPNTSTSISIINGQISSSRSYSYVLIPTKEGKITISSCVFNYNGKDYKTEPIEIEVVKGAVPQQKKSQTPQPSQPIPPDQTADLSKLIFIKTFVDKKNPYQNEGVTVTYKLYTRVQVSSFGISKPPNATGAWIEEYVLPQQPVLSTEVVDGISYQCAIVKKIELFPTNSGELTLESLVIQADVLIRRKTPTNVFDWNFDSFFNDDFFGRTIRRELIAPAVKLNVLPFPEVGKPAGFKNVTGKFTINSEVDKTDIMANEAISLKFRISGTGNIKLLEAPNVKVSGDFEKYEPKIEEKINRTGDNISGEKIFEYVLVPRLPGTQKIEPVSLSYFNPETKKYITLTTKGILINVSPGKERLVSLPDNIYRDEVKLVGSDVRFIKLKNVKWEKMGRKFYTDFVFLFLIFFPLCLIGITVFYNNHLIKINTDIEYRRSRIAMKSAEKRLKESSNYMNEESKERFYMTLSSALRGYIADKLNISEVGFLTDEVKETLENKKINGEITNKFIDLINACDYLRFAPAESKMEDMKRIFSESKNIILSLEKYLK